MNNDNYLEICDILKTAELEREKLRHPYVGSEHLLLALLKKASNLSKICGRYNLTYELFLRELIHLVGMSNKPSSINLYTPLLKRVINNAINDAKEKGCLVTDKDLLFAIFDEGEGIAIRVLVSLKIDMDALYNEIKNDTILESEDIDLKMGKNLNKTVNMNELTYNREKELQFVIETLLRKKKNNPLLIGDAGVGKTAIIEELARRINLKKVPRELHNKQIVMLEMGALVAGTKYRGEFEEKLNRIIHKLEDSKKYILFIDEMHSMVNAGGAEGAITAGDILKPYLARDSIMCIGATTTNEYNKYILPDKALVRRFELIKINEPSAEETIDILTQVKKEYENHHLVKISSSNIKLIVSLANSYLTNLKNPDKSLDLLDSICSYVKLKKDSSMAINELEMKLSKICQAKHNAVQASDYKKAIELKQQELKVKNQISLYDSHKYMRITSKDIYDVISQKSHIDIKRNYNRLVNKIEHRLKREIVGQEKAKEEFISYISNLSNKHHLITFLLQGPSGVGKTLFASEVAKSFNKKSFIIDAQDYYNDIDLFMGGIRCQEKYFLNTVRQNPDCVIIVNDIETASLDFLNILKKIIYQERIADAFGNIIDFKSCLLFIETNKKNATLMGFDQQNGLSKKDEIFDLKLYFDSLNEKEIKTILDIKKIPYKAKELEYYCQNGLKTILKKIPV